MKIVSLLRFKKQGKKSLFGNYNKNDVIKSKLKLVKQQLKGENTSRKLTKAS